MTQRYIKSGIFCAFLRQKLIKSVAVVDFGENGFFFLFRRSFKLAARGFNKTYGSVRKQQLKPVSANQFYIIVCFFFNCLNISIIDYSLYKIPNSAFLLNFNYVFLQCHLNNLVFWIYYFCRNKTLAIIFKLVV